MISFSWDKKIIQKEPDVFHNFHEELFKKSEIREKGAVRSAFHKYQQEKQKNTPLTVFFPDAKLKRIFGPHPCIEADSQRVKAWRYTNDKRWFSPLVFNGHRFSVPFGFTSL